MTSKSGQLMALKFEIALSDYDDVVKLDALLKRTLFLIKQFFGESSIYIDELKNLKFPYERNRDLSPGQYDHDLKISLKKLENLLDIMIEDLNLSEKSKITKEETGKTLPKSNSIFIVHGTDHKPMKELKAMLSGLGLNPIVLHEQPSSGKTVVEKLENYSDVGYAFVILTPDDGLFNLQETEKLLDGVESMKIKQNQREKLYLDSFFKMLRKVARQNVILELGYFMGLLGRNKVCCLYNGNVVLPSDIHGIVYVPFKDSVKEAKDMIIKELKACGYKVDANKIL